MAGKFIYLKGLTAIFLVTLWIITPSVVLAQDTGISGFNSHIFRPSTDDDGIYSLFGSDISPQWNYTARFFLNFAHENLTLVSPARPSNTQIIDNYLLGDWIFSISLFDFLSAGVDLPVVFYQNGTDFSDLSSYTKTALGDLRFNLKYRPFKKVNLAVLVGLTFPTGNRGIFFGDKTVTLEGKLIFDHKWKYVELFSNAGYRLINATNITEPLTGSTLLLMDDQLTFGAGGRVYLPFGERRWSIDTEFYGETVVRDFKKISSPMEIRGGMRYRFKSGLSIYAGGGHGLTSAYGSPSYRFFAGISFDSFRRRSKRGLINEVIRFKFGSDRIEKREKEKINDISRRLVDRPKHKVSVEGHTDNIGSIPSNDKLSRSRAERVADQLKQGRVQPQQMDIQWHGETRPIAPNSTEEGRKLNRRVEIKSVN